MAYNYLLTFTNKPTQLTYYVNAGETLTSGILAALIANTTISSSELDSNGYPTTNIEQKVVDTLNYGENATNTGGWSWHVTKDGVTIDSYTASNFGVGRYVFYFSRGSSPAISYTVNVVEKAIVSIITSTRVTFFDTNAHTAEQVKNKIGAITVVFNDDEKMATNNYSLYKNNGTAYLSSDVVSESYVTVKYSDATSYATKEVYVENRRGRFMVSFYKKPSITSFGIAQNQTLSKANIRSLFENTQLNVQDYLSDNSNNSLEIIGASIPDVLNPRPIWWNIYDDTNALIASSSNSSISDIDNTDFVIGTYRFEFGYDESDAISYTVSVVSTYRFLSYPNACSQTIYTTAGKNTAPVPDITGVVIASTGTVEKTAQDFSYRGVDQASHFYWYIKGYENYKPKTLEEGVYTYVFVCENDTLTCSVNIRHNYYTEAISVEPSSVTITANLSDTEDGRTDDEILSIVEQKIKKVTLRQTYFSGDTADRILSKDEYIVSYSSGTVTVTAKSNSRLTATITVVPRSAKTDYIWDLTLNLNDFRTVYVNYLDKLDSSSNIKAILTVYDAHDKDVVLHKEEITNGLTITVPPELSAYNDTNKIIEIQDLGYDLNDVYQYTVAYTYEYNNEGIEFSLPLDVSVIEIAEILGFSVNRYKPIYYLGEEFLSGDDDEELVMQMDYKNGKGEVRRTPQGSKLYDMSIFNIIPNKGYIFENIATNFPITITYTHDTTKSVQYSVAVQLDAQYAEGTTEHNLAFVLGNDSRDENQNIVKCYVKYANTNTIIGYIYDMNNATKNAKLVLYDNYIPAVDGQNNLSIKFPYYVQGNADYINKCHFGILFGNNNAKNRLFVSGNSARGNCDWHSGQINTSEDIRTGTSNEGNGDFSYFEDTSYCYYGETDNNVVAYDIVSNDKLLVLKDYSDKETTVYFRTPTLVTAIDGSGTTATGIDDETLYQEEFALSKGNNSVAGINPKAIANFNGDTVFVSDTNQLLGLDLVGIIGDNQRYANTRSYYIDGDLRERDLRQAWVWTNNKYLFLCLPEKTFITHYEAKGESQYEWWQVDVSDIQTIIEIDGVIYFGNSSGVFHKITDGYEDIKKIWLSEGSAIFNFGASSEDISNLDPASSDDTITFNSNISLMINEKCLFRMFSPYNYYTLGRIISQELYEKIRDGYSIYRSTNAISVGKGILIGINDDGYLNVRVRDGTMLDTIHSFSFNGTSTEYYFKYVEDNEYQVLRKADNERLLYTSYMAHTRCVKYEAETVNLYNSSSDFVCYKLDGLYNIINIDRVNNKFQISTDGTTPLDLYGSHTSFEGSIEYRTPVEAFYITAPMLASINYFKTIWQWTLTNDTNIPSEVELTFAHNKIPYESMKSLNYISDNTNSKSTQVSSDRLGFAFNTLNFRSVDFDKMITPRTYTNSRILSMVKFICFGFRNNNNTNAVLSTMSIIYTVAHQSYGGD